MIVEDDEDVMAYIKNELSPYFLLELAGNGQEALERLQQKGEDTIDLIVSDIRMPRMDGLTLLKKVRADDNLFDIPFILLTAINSIEKQIQGLRFGADDYLPKPFSPSVLVTRCLSLIQQRDKLRAIYTQKNVNATDNANDNTQEPVIISERDRNFRKIVDAKIDANLSNPGCRR